MYLLKCLFFFNHFYNSFYISNYVNYEVVISNNLTIWENLRNSQNFYLLLKYGNILGMHKCKVERNLG